MGERKRKILLVDDEPDHLLYLSAWLEDEGYEICTALDGRQGERALREHAPDIVLMDVKMPTQTGLELYRTMRRHEALRSIPVIFITGAAEFQVFDDDCGVLPEPSARMSKPVDLPALRAAIARALAGG